MKRRIIILIISLSLCLCLCIKSNAFVEKVMNNIMLYADNMEKTLNENQTERASLFAQQMKAYVDSMESILESLVPHEDLHNLSEQIEDASLSLRIQDYDDLRKALSLIKENAEHLIRHEAFCFSNIF